ncbi:protein of unknown function DUF302 [Mycolicibacterium rhodesiae JS60]|nr:protein of unknown function DUF302 [Mycolicibacterium rhodesiae JS60]
MAKSRRTGTDRRVAHPLSGGAEVAPTGVDTSRLVSRTGALAFTLGLGIAVATNAGAAMADTGSNSSSTGNSAQTGSTSSAGTAGPARTGGNKSGTAHSGRPHKPEQSLPSSQRNKSNRVNARALTTAVPSASPDVPTATDSETQTVATSQSTPEPSGQPATQVPGLATLHPLAAPPKASYAPAKPAATTISEAVALALGPGIPFAPPADVTMGGLLAWVRREFERAFFNHNPAINYDSTSNSQGPGGVITGDLQVTDAEGDPISYAVTDGPDSGTVTVATDGTFTYTPSEALASTGGTDSFTVTVSDETGPVHVHGLLGLLGGGPAHATTMQINVSVAAPQAGVNVIGNNVNRLDIIVNQSYSDFRAAFEAAVPTMSQDVLNVILAGQPNLDALIAATNANAPYGFIRYGSIPPFSLMLSAGFGYPPEASNVVQYLVGNHLFAEEMYREDQSVMLYAPLRAAIYQDADGKTHFVIDQPSTVFDSFDNPVIEATGNQIDEKLADLLTVLGAPAPNELNPA